MDNNLSRYVQPTASNLGALGPGCFAQINDNRCKAVWVEIDSEENGQFTGVVHSELCSIDSYGVYQNHERVSFAADRIVHLGCNRFCFC